MAACAMAGVGALAAAVPFVMAAGTGESSETLQTVDVDVADMVPGTQRVVMWQGKPVIIRHRTPQDIASAQAGDMSPDLSDPATDAQRVRHSVIHDQIAAQWLVMVAVCSHLGCTPGPAPVSAQDAGGWVCPCHGSRFDASGRARSGPARRNMPVPPYRFITPTLIRIGESA